MGCLHPNRIVFHHKTTRTLRALRIYYRFLRSLHSRKSCTLLHQHHSTRDQYRLNKAHGPAVACIRARHALDADQAIGDQIGPPEMLPSGCELRVNATLEVTAIQQDESLFSFNQVQLTYSAADHSNKHQD